MQADLAAYLAQHTPRARGEAVWGGGRVSLCMTTYLSAVCPPLAYVTSVRALLLHGESVMVLHNRDGVHILPGGRREPGETLRREVLEETGWTLAAPRLLGFTHFHNRSPRLPEYAHFPYPDFVQIVYLAVAEHWRPAAQLVDDYEVMAGFQPLASVQTLPLSPGERVFLMAAHDHAADQRQP